MCCNYGKLLDHTLAYLIAAMGKEISRSRFQKRDFLAFEERLRAETALLRDWFEHGGLSTRSGVGGFELECWLVDPHGYPAPLNEKFLDTLRSPLVVPELSRFNVEINTLPRQLEAHALRDMYKSLEQIWEHCQAVAETLGAHMLMIGILPTVTEQHLTLANVSKRVRYRALNEQILRLRKGAPIELNIEGPQPLYTFHSDVMLEAGTTSFQVHLQVAPHTAARYYNASLILSAPVVAACANSPYLFGHELWDETRIPLFEQSVSMCPPDAAQCPPNRVSFGSGYVHSLHECFVENLERYPVLLPEIADEPPERLYHLRLHNGTIWRWNRPLVGFDGGTAHLRIEHRVVPAGPSLLDTIANAALYFGLVQQLASASEPPEMHLPFAQARDNFYAAARYGLRAELVWLDGRRVGVRGLLRDALLPLAREGLAALGVESEDIERNLGIIERRVTSGRNGADWQRRYVARHGPDMRALTTAYLRCQKSGAPVHEWEV